MKANQSIKNLKQDQAGYVKIVGGLVALLLMIIVGVMVFWSVSESIPGTGEQTETFTWASPQSAGANLVVTLTGATPNSITKVWIHNSTSGGSHANVTTGITISGYRTVTVAHAGIAAEYNHAVVYYESNIGADSDESTDMASTVFGLLPIVALAVVASIIIGVIIGFGGGGKM